MAALVGQETRATVQDGGIIRQRCQLTSYYQQFQHN